MVMLYSTFLSTYSKIPSFNVSYKLEMMSYCNILQASWTKFKYDLVLHDMESGLACDEDDDLVFYIAFNMIKIIH